MKPQPVTPLNANNPTVHVRSFYDALARGDAPTALGVLADDIEWIDMKHWPYHPSARGPQHVAADVLLKMKAEWNHFSATAHEFFRDGDTVIVLGVYGGSHATTGKTLRAPFTHVWDMHEGKCNRFRQYTDTFAVQDSRVN